MKFHVQFTYKPDERENVMRFLRSGGLAAEGPVKLIGSWVAIQTGIGFALIVTKDAKAVYDMCSEWSEYGQIVITPVIDSAEL